MDGVEFKELFKAAVETLREKTITSAVGSRRNLSGGILLMQSGIISIGTSWKREYI